ncbi:hypothetical protein Bbelb_408250 [Branchiostoma belcheri]|nr:hypothetical protein Bbelb_408250 [Branchiostoma belcheri]
MHRIARNLLELPPAAGWTGTKRRERKIMEWRRALQYATPTARCDSAVARTVPSSPCQSNTAAVTIGVLLASHNRKVVTGFRIQAYWSQSREGILRRSDNALD